MNAQSKIYVAGHRGMVGSAVCEALKKSGFQNLIFSTSKETDLRNQEQTQRFFRENRPEYVFLAAAKVGGIVANNTFRADFIYDNLMIEANVIRACYDFGVKKLLFLGSSCIYPKFAPQPLREEYLLTSELEPTNEPYAVAKIAGIKLCDAFRAQYGCNFISVMPTNLYGANDNYDLQNSHVLPALIRKMHLGKLLQNNLWNELRNDFAEKTIEGKTFAGSNDEIAALLDKFGVRKRQNGKIEVEIWGTGTPLREFLHADDLADACLYLMQHYDEAGLVNIGTGTDISIKDLALTIQKIVGFEGEIYFNDSKPDGTPRKLLSVEKLHQKGWKHRIELEEGISQVYQNYCRHKALKS
jgi:GDP-L-fucose synthase